MNELSRYDLKQLRLIEKKIALFENNKIDLLDLINDLGGLLDTLESVANSWRDNFRAGVNSLEIIHNSIEDSSISKWKGDFEEDLQKSILNLKKLTISLLEGYLKASDPSVLESAIEADSKWLICPNCKDAWESNSLNAMVVCPKCERAFHNPRIKH